MRPPKWHDIGDGEGWADRLATRGLVLRTSSNDGAPIWWIRRAGSSENEAGGRLGDDGLWMSTLRLPPFNRRQSRQAEARGLAIHAAQAIAAKDHGAWIAAVDAL